MSTTFSVRGASSGWVFDLGQGVISMETVLCTRCGLLYALPEAMIDAAREKGHSEITWRCPNNSCNANSWGYHGKSKAEKTAHRLQLEREDNARLRADRDQLQASVRSERAAKTRFKNQRDQSRTRAAAAVCPCCNRSFVQLRRHIANQHPDYKTSDDA